MGPDMRRAVVKDLFQSCNRILFDSDELKVPQILVEEAEGEYTVLPGP